MSSGSTGGPARRVRGFSYMLLLMLLAILSAAAAYTVQLGHAAQRRHAEEALLRAGQDFAQAIGSYRRAGMEGGATALPPAGPPELQDLLRDPRVPGIRRHLRRIPPDPLTGGIDWGVVRDSQGGIISVFSRAPGVPIKRTGFNPGQQGFDEAQSYADWRFGAR